MRLPQRHLAFLLVLLYTAVLVAGCFCIWSLERVTPTWRFLTIAVAVIGWSWSLTEDMTADQVLPRVGGFGRNEDRA